MYTHKGDNLHLLKDYDLDASQKYTMTFESWKLRREDHNLIQFKFRNINLVRK